MLAISYVSYSRVNTKPLYSVSRSFNNANKKMRQCAIARVLCSELSMRTVLKCVNQRAFVAMCEDIYRATSFLHYSQSINNLMYSGTAGELEHYERFLRDPFFHMNVIIIDPDRGLIFGWIWSQRRFHFQSFKGIGFKKNEIVYLRTLVIFTGGCHLDTFFFVFSEV